MRPPAGLSQAARRAWCEAASAIEDAGHAPEEFRAPLRLYAIAAGRLAEVEVACRTSEHAGLGPPGSRGQRVTHPYLIELRALEEHVVRLAESLPLSPRGRASGRGKWPLARPRSTDRPPPPLPETVRELLDGDADTG